MIMWHRAAQFWIEFFDRERKKMERKKRERKRRKRRKRRKSEEREKKEGEKREKKKWWRMSEDKGERSTRVWGEAREFAPM